MSNDVVEAITAENKKTRDKRQTLEVRMKAIQGAKDICANLVMRNELRMYAKTTETMTTRTQAKKARKSTSRNHPERQQKSPSTTPPASSHHAPPKAPMTPARHGTAPAYPAPHPLGVTGGDFSSSPGGLEMPARVSEYADDYYAMSS